MKDSSPKPSKEQRKKLLIEMMKEDEKNGMYERTAEEILLDHTGIQAYKNSPLINAMEEYRSLSLPPNFWKRLEMFVENVQVSDPMSEEEKEMILNVAKRLSTI